MTNEDIYKLLVEVKAELHHVRNDVWLLLNMMYKFMTKNDSIPFEDWYMRVWNDNK